MMMQIHNQLQQINHLLKNNLNSRPLSIKTIIAIEANQGAVKDVVSPTENKTPTSALFSSISIINMLKKPPNFSKN